ncbi:hypothetical protein C7475_10111 [Chitinophaga sp. S165]|nr:hypothetical protein C7475_10111 [Chitinophaga sp. S165]
MTYGSMDSIFYCVLYVVGDRNKFWYNYNFITQIQINLRVKNVVSMAVLSFYPLTKINSYETILLTIQATKFG